MAGENVQAPTDPMALLNSLLQTFGGTQTKTNPGDTAALEQALTGLRGQDGAALLASIFQKAGGQIPGIQNALSNAVGARTGGNSAVAAALQKLLQSTTVEAQSQLANQQLENLKTQVTAGNSIANATKGTAQQSGTNTGNAAKNLAILSLISKSGLFEKLGMKAPTGLSTPAQSTAPPVLGGGNVPAVSSPANLSSAPVAPGMFSNAALSAAGTSGGAPSTLPASSFVAPESLEFGGQSVVNLANYNPYQPSVGDQLTEAFSRPSGPMSLDPGQAPAFDLAAWASSPAPEIPSFDFENFDLGFADGGMVGRDGHSGHSAKPTAEKGWGSEEPEESQERQMTKLMLKHMNSMAKIVMGDDEGHMGKSGATKKPDGYADGGVVGARGSRVSSNPTVTLEPAVGTNATPFDSSLQAAFAPPVPATPGRAPLQPTAGTGYDDQDKLIADGAGTGGTAGVAGTAMGSTASGVLGGISAASSISGMLGGPSLGPIGGVLGLANSPNPTAAIGTIASSVIGAMNPTLGMTLGVTNGVLGMLGMNSIGQTISNLSTPSVDLSLSQAVDPSNNAVANSGVVGSPVSGPGVVGVTDLGMLGLDAPAEGGGSANGDDGSGGSGTSGDGQGGDGPGGGRADGGPVWGPGNGTVDTIQNVDLANGEYVMPTDVVEMLGVNFFDAIKDAFHTPVAQQRAQAGQSSQSTQSRRA